MLSRAVLVRQMLSRLNQGMTLALIAFTLLALIGMSNLLFSGIRLDLTEAKLYTLTDGTREILAEMDEPITLYFFFSDKSSEDLTALRTYANRVESMLEEYQRAADGKIELRLIDPEPFSEEEDMAAGFGLQSVPVNQSGEVVYFGLAGTNAVDEQEIIAFFQPDREQYLEYELSKLVSTLARPAKPVLGLYAELPVDDQMDPATLQPQPGWVLVSQLRELFKVEMVDSIDMDILKYDLLLLVHPKSVGEGVGGSAGRDVDEGDEGDEDSEGKGEEALFALDQFLMQGGRLIAFVDPIAESDVPEDPSAGGNTASSLNVLTEKLGVTLRQGEVLGDAGAALVVNTTDGKSMRHLGILGFGKGQLSADNITTSQLETVNFSTTGLFDVTSVDGITVENLVQSSESAMPVQAVQFQFLSDPTRLQAGFNPTGEIYPVAVLVSGNAATQFPDGIEGYDGDLLEETDALQLALVADTDLLTDRLWAQVQNFFGQRIATPFADNSSFITNLVENLSGSNALISVRSRGQFSRPFTIVEELRRQAEASYQQSEEALQAQLEETERQLNELQNIRIENGRLTMTREQAEALQKFQQQKVSIRKELRDVRHQLDKDIETLGSQIKFLNIVLMPLLLTGLLIVWRLLRLGRRKEVQV